MKSLRFLTGAGELVTQAEFIHAYDELVFEAVVTDEPALRVRLPLETNLDEEFLVSLASQISSLDFFGEASLTFEGADLDYAYTFDEILREAGLSLEIVQEADWLVLRGRA